jgi:hypothetical protein
LLSFYSVNFKNLGLLRLNEKFEISRFRKKGMNGAGAVLGQ